MSIRFQAILTSALSADYVNSDLFDHVPSLRLATVVVNRNEEVAISIEHHGHSFEFKDVKSEEAEEPTNVESEEQAKVHLRTTGNHDKLEDLMYGEHTIDGTVGKDTLEWIKRVYKDSRGFELGTFDSSLLAMTMKTQSVKWEDLALGYISDVVSMAHSFIVDLLKELCPDVRMRNGLSNVLMEDLVKMYRSAIDHVHFLLHVERAGTPATLNQYFSECLENRY